MNTYHWITSDDGPIFEVFLPIYDRGAMWGVRWYRTGKGGYIVVMEVI